MYLYSDFHTVLFTSGMGGHVHGTGGGSNGTLVFVLLAILDKRAGVGCSCKIQNKQNLKYFPSKVFNQGIFRIEPF